MVTQISSATTIGNCCLRRLRDNMLKVDLITMTLLEHLVVERRNSHCDLCDQNNAKFERFDPDSSTDSQSKLLVS